MMKTLVSYTSFETKQNKQPNIVVWTSLRKFKEIYRTEPRITKIHRRFRRTTYEKWIVFSIELNACRCVLLSDFMAKHVMK